MTKHFAIVEIDWAEDRAGLPIDGPVGPFDSEEEADRWAVEAIYNGEWNTALLHLPMPVDPSTNVEVGGHRG